MRRVVVVYSRVGGGHLDAAQLALHLRQRRVRVAGVDAMHVEVTGNVGTRQPQVTGCGDEVGQPTLVEQVEMDR